MHFEILVEGQADLTALSILMPNIVGEYDHPHTWRIHKHRGVGIFPENLAAKPNKNDPTLLHNLPSKLRGYGEEKRDDLVVVVLIDLDDRKDCIAFKNDLMKLLGYCVHEPQVLFRIAVEELEAWFLGDRKALQQAYPKVDTRILDEYIQDSQCGTWEKLARAIYPGGLEKLKQDGPRSVKILKQKRIWAKDICRYMDVHQNRSSSFRAFRDGLQRFAVA